MPYYKRDLETVLCRGVAAFRVVILTGARQTGKSTLLQKLLGKSHQYVSLDDPRALKLALDDPELFLSEHECPIVIDEFQYAAQLVPYIKLKVDRLQKKGMFVLTGSQQFTMMKNVQETLAGRAGLFHLLPMSMSEGKRSSQTYLFKGLVGSYPELVVTAKHDPEKWYSSYVATYIERDVQPHYQLEKITYFRDLLFLLATRSTQVLNYASLSNDLGVSISAIKLWIRILEASQIIYLLRPYYVNLGSRIVKSPKVYFTDIGLLNYLLGNKQRKSLLKGPQAGVIFENFVIQETLKYFFNKGQSAPIYYYRTNNGLEVDLLVEEKRGIVRPCEIKLTKTPRADMLRPIDRLRELNKKKKIVISKGSLITLRDGRSTMSRSAVCFGLADFLRSLD